MIYIAKNGKGLPVGIISCKNKDQAIAYWQGMNLNYDSIKEFSTEEEHENEKLGFVTPLLKTKVSSFRREDSFYKADILKVIEVIN